MTQVVLDKLPYLDRRHEVLLLSGEVVTFLRHQIVVWVCVTGRHEDYDSDLHPSFPAIVDTGTNRPFFATERHLTHWAGVLDPLTPAPASGGLFHWHVRETPIPIWRLPHYNVAILPNLPGARETDTTAEPYNLEIEPFVFPSRPPIKLRSTRHVLPEGPRVPVLGLPAFERRHLHLHIDTAARTLTVRE